MSTGPATKSTNDQPRDSPSPLEMEPYRGAVDNRIVEHISRIQGRDRHRMWSRLFEKNLERSGRSRHGSDSLLLWQHDQYSSGSEIHHGVPHTHKAYRTDVSLDSRTCSGWRYQPSTHQHESSDSWHLHQSPRSRQASAIHVRSSIDDLWLPKLEGEYKREPGTSRSGHRILSESGINQSGHQLKGSHPSWAWGGMLWIKLNLALCVNTPFQNLWALNGQKSHHYSLQISYVTLYKGPSSYFI